MLGRHDHGNLASCVIFTVNIKFKITLVRGSVGIAHVGTKRPAIPDH